MPHPKFGAAAAAVQALRLMSSFVDLTLRATHKDKNVALSIVLKVERSSCRGNCELLLTAYRESIYEFNEIDKN